MTWYFAYGSNLWIDQMVARTGFLPFGVERPWIARLTGYRFSFNMRGEDGQMYANIERPGEYVLGVVYACTQESLKKLDAFERGYHRQQVVVVGDSGSTVEAVTYLAERENVIDGGRPSSEYLQHILRGGRQHGMPESYLGEIENVAAAPHVTLSPRSLPETSSAREPE